MTIAPLHLPDARLRALVDLADEEGFEFVRRLDAEWQSGANRFDGTGEILLAVTDGEALLAVGGLNIDPYETSGQARLRHVYVVPERRGTGIGRALVEALLAHARTRFAVVRLRTNTEAAAKFYLRLGFRSIEAQHATHEIAFA